MPYAIKMVLKRYFNPNFIREDVKERYTRSRLIKKNVLVAESVSIFVRKKFSRCRMKNQCRLKPKSALAAKVALKSARKKP